MEITIKINGRMVPVEVSDEVAGCYDQGRRKAENLFREKRRHWDDWEFDEYIAATEGLLPHQPTPEDIVCQRETLDLLLSILDTCTQVQRDRFLIYALYDYTYDEIGLLYGYSKYAVRNSIESVRKNFSLDCPHQQPVSGLPGEGSPLKFRKGGQAAQYENQVKILLNKQRDAERHARNHRLIVHGAIMEGVFPFTASMDGESLRTFLIVLSRLPRA